MITVAINDTKPALLSFGELLEFKDKYDNSRVSLFGGFIRSVIRDKGTFIANYSLDDLSHYIYITTNFIPSNRGFLISSLDAIKTLHLNLLFTKINGISREFPVDTISVGDSLFLKRSVCMSSYYDKPFTVKKKLSNNTYKIYFPHNTHSTNLSAVNFCSHSYSDQSILFTGEYKNTSDASGLFFLHELKFGDEIIRVKR